MTQAVLAPPGDVRGRFRIDLAYDGTDFHGWARQPGLRTVQGVLEYGLDRVLGPDAVYSVVVAGRTDAGVHARHQVAHLDIAQARELSNRRQAPPATVLLRKLRGAIARDSDLVIHRVAPAPVEFDARFSATGRAYAYRIADAESFRDPLRRRDTLWANLSLDVEAMAAMAARQLGFRDWAAFCKPREGATTLRTLTDFSWHRDAEGVLVASVAADAFCHNMVRYLVGASLAVGRGRLSIDDVDDIREAGEHVPAIVVAPPHGLTLVKVTYPDSVQGLAEQAGVAKARRSADGDSDAD